MAVSVMTLAELRVGVLVADDPETRARRLATLERAAQPGAPLPIDEPVSVQFASLVARLRSAGRNPRVIDTLIAATAMAHGAGVATQDDDFDDLGVAVVKL